MLGEIEEGVIKALMKKRSLWAEGGIGFSFSVFMLVLGSLALVPSAYAVIINGDFQTGDLQGWSIQEDYLDVLNSDLVVCTDIGSGNYVGTLLTGYTQYGIYVTSLVLFHK